MNLKEIITYLIDNGRKWYQWFESGTEIYTWSVINERGHVTVSLDTKNGKWQRCYLAAFEPDSDNNYTIWFEEDMSVRWDSEWKIYPLERLVNALGVLS